MEGRETKRRKKAKEMKLIQAVVRETSQQRRAASPFLGQEVAEHSSS